MTYYIQHDHTGLIWNGVVWQEDLTVICAFEDYDEAQKNAMINDLTNYSIKIWN